MKHAALLAALPLLALSFAGRGDDWTQE